MSKKLLVKKKKEIAPDAPAPRTPKKKSNAWDGTNTCSGCDARWKSVTAAHCGNCHRTFSSVSLFDAHRSTAGEHGKCLDPAKLRDGKGNRTHYWREGHSGLMWRGPELTEEQKEKIYGRKK